MNCPISKAHEPDAVASEQEQALTNHRARQGLRSFLFAGRLQLLTLIVIHGSVDHCGPDTQPLAAKVVPMSKFLGLYAILGGTGAITVFAPALLVVWLPVLAYLLFWEWPKSW